MNIAIIGTGISGLGAAYLLHPQHQLTLYEKNDYIGGHSRTLDVVTPQGKVPVDTGFIVFNKRNYPNLLGLFGHAGVPYEPSDMSFAASIDDGWLEYGTKDLKSIFAQRRNILRPQFWKMVSDVLRFHKQALAYLDAAPDITLGQCLDALKMGEWFRRYFILAMGGAIWSCPLKQMLEFPARSFVRFFHNHGLLTINDQPQWHTVTGGSREYVARITAPFKDRILLNDGVISVSTDSNGVVIESQSGVRRFDKVIFACHADQALALLKQPSQDQRRLLSRVRYQPNKVVLHSDTSFMPKNAACWASWVYLCEQREDNGQAVSLSYWMNNLQNLRHVPPVIVTLNPSRMPAEDKIYNVHHFEHPVFDAGAMQTQEEISRIQGVDNMWFCGAWTRYGFHEDGLSSGVDVARQLGAAVPWN